MHLWLMRIARIMAILGALVLCSLILMTCVSVIGRELNALLNSELVQSYAPTFAQSILDMGIGPVLGDFELLENMMPFTIFAFLPLAQTTASHATVDIFTSHFPKPLLAWMRVITEILFAAVLVLFSIKLYEGMQAKMRYGETTYLIQFPVWWAYAAACCASVIAAIVGVLMAGLLLTSTLNNRPINFSADESGQ